MKKATGELSNTIFAIIFGAILIAFFYTVGYPIIRNNFQKETQCEKAKCESTPNADGMVNCVIFDNDGNASDEFECKYKG